MSGKLQQIQGQLGKMPGFLKGAFSATAIIAAGKQVIDYASTLSDLSETYKISTSGLQRLEMAFAPVGVSLETVTKSAGILASNIAGGDKSVVATLAKLGLSARDLQKLPIDQQFIKVGDAIGNIQNSGERLYASRTLLGKGGTELLAGLTGHLAETTAQLDAMGLVISEDTIAAADKFGDELGVMGKQLLGVVAAIVGPLLPALSATLNAFVDIGKVVGGVVGFALKGVVIAIAGVWEAFAMLLSYLADAAQKIPFVGKHLSGLADVSAWLQGSVAGTARMVEKLSFGTETAGEMAAKTAPKILGLGAANDEAAKAVQKHQEAMVELNSAGVGWEGTLDTIDGSVVEAVKHYLDAGVAQGALATAYGLTDVQVKAVASSMESEKAMTKTLDEIRSKTHSRMLARMDDERKAMDESNKILIANFSDEQTYRREHERTIQALSLDSFEQQEQQVAYWLEDERRALQARGGDWQAAYAALQVVATDKLSAIFGAKQTAKLKAEAERQAQALKHSWVGGFDAILDDVPGILKSALTGGGGLSGAGAAIASQAGGLIGKKLGTGIGDMIDKNTVGELIPKLTKMIPMVGEAIGALAGPLISKIGSLFGAVSPAVKQARADLDKFREGLHATLTATQLQESGNEIWKMDLIAVRDLFAAVGRSAADAERVTQALWNTDDPDAMKAAMAEIDATLANVRRRADEFKSALDGVKGAVDVTHGVITPMLRESILRLAEMKGLTESERQALIDLANDTKPKFAELIALAEDYGIGLAGLGPQFQQAALNDSALRIYDAFELLTQAGADVGGVLAGMQDEISQLVQDARQFGGTIPEQFRPLIEELARSGRLLDENGEKITDLSGITFANTPLSTGIDRLADTIDHLADVLSRLPGMATAVANSIPPNPFVDWVPPEIDDWSGIVWGGLQADGGAYHVTEPTMFIAGEAGPEDVVFSGAGQTMGSMVEGGDGGRDYSLDILNELRWQRTMIPMAIRDALQRG